MTNLWRFIRILIQELMINTLSTYSTQAKREDFHSPKPCSQERVLLGRFNTTNITIQPNISHYCKGLTQITPKHQNPQFKPQVLTSNYSNLTPMVRFRQIHEIEIFEPQEYPLKPKEEEKWSGYECVNAKPKSHSQTTLNRLVRKRTTTNAIVRWQRHGGGWATAE